MHIPGVLNQSADKASRKQYESETEWQLNREIFHQIEEILGPFDLDLFASRINTQCQKFFAWRPDPDAFAIDAFSHSWSNCKGYAFPPFSVMGRVLQKVRLEKAELVLIAPLWTSQPWFAALLQMSISHPVLLPHRKDIVLLPQQPLLTHALIKKLHLTVFHLSGNT